MIEEKCKLEKLIPKILTQKSSFKLMEQKHS
jgi:hypothetical protein